MRPRPPRLALRFSVQANSGTHQDFWNTLGRSQSLSEREEAAILTLAADTDLSA
jgi:hypothetical protein